MKNTFFFFCIITENNSESNPQVHSKSQFHYKKGILKKISFSLHIQWLQTQFLYKMLWDFLDKNLYKMPPTAIVCPFAEIWTRRLPFPSCATCKDLSFLLSVMHIAAGRWTFCLHFTPVLILFFWRTYSLYLSFTNFHLPPWFSPIDSRLENRAIQKKIKKKITRS